MLLNSSSRLEAVNQSFLRLSNLSANCGERSLFDGLSGFLSSHGASWLQKNSGSGFPLTLFMM